MVGMLLTVSAIVIVVRVLQGQPRKRPTAPHDDPRWRESAGEQLTGKSCAECNDRILIEGDGRRCKKCRQPVHKKACSKRHKALVHPIAGPTPYR